MTGQGILLGSGAVEHIADLRQAETEVAIIRRAVREWLQKKGVVRKPERPRSTAKKRA